MASELSENESGPELSRASGEETQPEWFITCFIRKKLQNYIFFLFIKFWIKCISCIVIICTYENVPYVWSWREDKYFSNSQIQLRVNKRWENYYIQL